MAKTWRQIADEYREEAKSSDMNHHYFGLEDAGYAYGALAATEKFVARLCELLDSNNVPVPSWIDPEPIEVTDKISVIETATGWRVKTTPKSFYDGTEYRKFGGHYSSKEKAFSVAEQLIDVLENLENRHNNAVVQAESHIVSEPEEKVNVITFTFE